VQGNALLSKAEQEHEKRQKEGSALAYWGKARSLDTFYDALDAT